jgi:hypothetical protein
VPSGRPGHDSGGDLEPREDRFVSGQADVTREDELAAGAASTSPDRRDAHDGRARISRAVESSQGCIPVGPGGIVTVFAGSRSVS